jgi:phosphoribosylformylglycinamidine synthase
MGQEGLRLDSLLFGESQGRIILTVPQAFQGKCLEQAKILGIPAQVIGTTGGDHLSIQVQDKSYRWSVGQLHDGWFNSIHRIMDA